MSRRGSLLRLVVKKAKFIMMTTVLCSLLLLCSVGLMETIGEEPYASFTYALEVDMPQLVADLKNGRAVDVKPINVVQFDILKTQPCSNKISNLIVVKSAVNHFNNRAVIRRSWGSLVKSTANNVGLVFMLGQSLDPEVNSEVDKESSIHGDVVQASFIDSYYNNTLKTITCLKWCHNSCKGVQFFFFVDDDYYVSVDNLVKFLRSLPHTSTSRFWMGHLWVNSKPDRGRWWMQTKWTIPLSDYPYEYWPPFMNGGAYIMSADVIEDFQLAADYTAYLKFDDVYLGILAKKLDVEGKSNLTLFPTPMFLTHKMRADDEHMSHVIATHRFGLVSEVEHIWRRWSRS